MNEDYRQFVDELKKLGATDDQILKALEIKIREDQEAMVQPQTQQDTGVLAPFRHMVEQAGLPADPNAPKPIDPLKAAWRRGMNLSETSDIIAPDNTPDDAQLAEVARLQQEQQAATPSQAYAKFTSAQTTGESLKALAENPIQIMGEIFLESVAGQVGGWENIALRTAQGGATGAIAGSVLPGLGTSAGLTGGLSSGLITGMAETSTRLEWAGKFLEALQEAGVNTSDPEALKEAFTNEEILSEAKRLAYLKAVPIGFLDLVSGGVAGKIISKPATSLLGKIGTGAAELAVQGALGGGGEALGQIASGEELNPSAIISEIVGEGATAPVEIAVGAANYHQTRAEDPVIADAEQDVQVTGDINLDLSIDEQYDEIAKRMDELTFEPVGDDEIRSLMGEAGVQDMYFPAANEENELADIEYTPEEARAIQVGAGLPPQAEQELNLDDSERMPAVDAAKEFEQSESERLEFESRYTPEELAQMSEEDAVPGPVRRAKEKFEQQPLVDDTKDQSGVPGKVRRRKEPKQAEPDKGISAEAPTTSGVLQTQEEEKVAPTKLEQRLEKLEEAKAVRKFSWDKLDEATTQELEERLEDETGVPVDERDPAKVRALESELAKRSTEKVKRVRTKAPVDPEQQRQDRIVKYQGQLANIIREKKPGKKLQRLQILNERTLELPEVNEQVQSEIKKLQDRTSAQTLEKELKNLTPKERITRIRERIADDTMSAPLEVIESAVDRNVKDVTEESYNQLDEAFKQVSGKGLFSTEYAELSRIVTTLKKEWDKALEPAREEAKALAAAQKAETRTKQTDKDSHLTAIAKAVAQDNPVSIKQALEEYKSWRKTQGLSETTDEKALKAAGAEFYRDKAETELKREAEVQAAKERKEREAKAKAAKKAIKKQFGLDEDAEFKAIDTRVLNPMEFNEDFGDVLWQLTNVKAIGLDGLIKLLHVAYPGKGNYVDGLTKLLGITSKIVAKHNKKGLEIYTAKIPKEVGMSGFHMYDRQQRKQILVINNNFLMVETAGGVAAHEAIHAIVAAIIDQLNLIANIPNASGIFVPKSYGNSWREFHHQVSQLLTALSTDIGDMYTTLTRKAESGEKLNGKETAFVALMSAYVAQYDPKLKPFDSKEGLAVLIKDFYAKGNLNYFLTNTDELLAEAFSNPYVTGILSIFESPFAPTTGKMQSYFRQIFDQLVEMVNQLIKLLKLPHIENNYFKALSNYMETMEDIAFNREEDTDWNIQHPIDGVGEVLNEFHAMAMVNNPINRLTPQLKTLINYIANAWYKRADIVSLEGVERELEAINAKTTKNKFGQADANLIWKKIQKYRQRIADAKVIQANALDYAQTHLPEYQTSKPFRRDIEDFAAVDIDGLTLSQVAIIEQGILDLVMGVPPANRAYNLVNKDVAVKKLNALLEHKGKYSKNPGIYPLFPVKLSVSMLANPATFSSILARYNTKAAQELYNTMFHELTRARSWTLRESQGFTAELFDLVEKHKLGHSDSVRAGMFGAAFSTKLSPNDPDYWTEVEFNLARIIEHAQNKVEANKDELFGGRGERKLVETELKVAQELYNTITQRRRMDGILTRGQQALYDKFREFSTKHEADVERSTRGIWGADFERQFNYFPTYALGNVNTGNLGGRDELIPNNHVNNLWEALRSNNNYGMILGKQTGRSKRKLQPRNYFYDYDLMSIAHKFAPSILFDLYATRELKALNQLINGNQGNMISSNKQNIFGVLSKKAVRGLNRQIKSIVGGAVMYDTEAWRGFKAIENLKNSYAVATLGTIGQLAVQISSAPSAALLMSPKGVTKALAVVTGIERQSLNVSKLKVALDKLSEAGASITIRDILFERFQTIEDINKEGWGRAAGSWKAKAEAWTTKALRGGDKFAARLVWFSEFFAQGGTLENPSEKAIMAAERAVGILQNMSDVAFSAPFLRSNHPAVRILLQMLYAFQSFALNAGLNSIYGIKYSFLTNNREARQIAAATLAMAASYHAVNLYLIRPMYEASSAAIFGDDEEEDEEKNYTKEDEFLWATLWDLLIAQWAPNFLESAIKSTGAEYLKNRAERKGEEFDIRKDIPLYVPESRKDIMAEGVGIYGNIGLAAADIGTMTLNALDRLESGEELEVDAITVDGIRAWLLLSKMMPMRGDLQKLLRNYSKKLKAEERAAKAGKTFPEGVEGIEVGTEFELPDYSIDIPDDPTELPEIE